MHAALELLGTQGLHALTHARVDAAAGIPRGSTSNYFRTRAALLQGVVAELTARDHDTWSGDATPDSVDSLVDVLAAFIGATTGPMRVHTTARYTLQLEGIHDPTVREPIARGRRQIEEWAVVVLTAIHAPDPQSATATILAYVDGVILHQLSFGPSEVSITELRRVVTACMR